MSRAKRAALALSLLPLALAGCSMTEPASKDFVLVNERPAKAEESGLRVREAFSGREAGRLMSYPAVTIPIGLSVETAVERYFVPYRYTAFPVLEGERPVGLLDLRAVERVPADERRRTSVGRVATIDPELIVDEHEDVGEEIHLYGAHAGAFAGFAASAFHIEGEAARLVATDLGLRQLGVDLPDIAEDVCIRRRI